AESVSRWTGATAAASASRRRGLCVVSDLGRRGLGQLHFTRRGFCRTSAPTKQTRDQRRERQRGGDAKWLNGFGAEVSSAEQAGAAGRALDLEAEGNRCREGGQRKHEQRQVGDQGEPPIFGEEPLESFGHPLPLARRARARLAELIALGYQNHTKRILDSICCLLHDGRRGRMATAAFTGLTAGAIHAVAGPDHVLSLAPVSFGRPRGAWRVGLLWGIGHGIGTIVAALGLFLFAAALPLSGLEA